LFFKNGEFTSLWNQLFGPEGVFKNADTEGLEGVLTQTT
jgi:hypothetical protein